MQRTETVTVQTDIQHSFSVLSDLSTYTQWLNFIDSVEPVESEDGRLDARSQSPIGAFLPNEKTANG
ncbi:MAG: hypothetical protein CM15mP49_33570 [Actinomycetota bacterium]|nr:MAG: hypothetical protein CM15mP49_33570 [Actinomycetota bacterium]